MAKHFPRFRDIKIGEKFYCNGHVWLKRSSRTAHLVNFSDYWQYFPKDTILWC